MPGVEVLNFGMPGMQAAGVAVLASQLDAISPDLVVIYSGHNDYNNDVFLGKIGGVKLWMIPVYQWLAKSWAYATLNRGSVPSAHKQRGRGGSSEPRTRPPLMFGLPSAVASSQTSAWQ